MSYVDLHAHVLPALDDGPSSFAESLALIETAWAAGTRRMAATPHMFQSGLGSDNSQRVSERFEEFSERLESRRAEIGGSYLEGFDLALGAENFVSETLLESLAHGEVLTLAGSRYLLVEFWPLVTATAARQAVGAVQDRGLVPVLAHVERYGFLQNEPGRLADLVAAGCVAQVNAAALLGLRGLRPAQLADRWLRHGLIAVVASDAHNTASRPPHLDAAADHLSSRYGAEVAEDCLRRNPTAILEDGAVRPPSPARRWWQRGG